MSIFVPTLELSFDKGPRKGESLQCKPSQVTRIGRVVRGNTLAVKDGGISQKHLVLRFLPDISRWTVTDLDTSNGTLVNALPIPPSTPSTLADGDTIKIGETTSISVHISEISQAVAPSPLMSISVPTLELSFDKGPRKGESLLCKPSQVTRIGRVVRGNTLAVLDGGISQKHLVLRFLPDISRWTVTDLDTSNGTLVNALPIPPSTPSTLAYGDIIKIGETTSISVHVSEASQAVAAAGRSAKDPEPEAAAVAELTAGRSVKRGKAAASEVAAVPVVQAISERRSARRGKGATEAEKELDCALDPTVVEEAVPLRSTQRGKRVDVPVAEPAKEDIAAASEVVAVPVQAISARRSTRRGKGATEAEKELDCALDPTVVEEAVTPRSTRRGKRVHVPVAEPAKEDIAAEECGEEVTRGMGRGRGATAKEPLDAGAGGDTEFSVLKEDEPAEKIGGD